MMVKRVFRAAVCAAVLLLASATGTAAAATWSGSESFDLNDHSPTFNPEPQLPPLTFAVTYDTAGTVTLTESGGNVPNDIGSFEQLANGTPNWSYFNWETRGVDVSGGSNADISISEFGATLTVSGIEGSLSPQVTPSPDGRSVTAVWSNALLANLDVSYVTIDGTTFFTGTASSYEYSDDGGSFYFTGDSPQVRITAPLRRQSVAHFRATPLKLSASMSGVAAADESDGITGFSATGLPPGLAMSRHGLITGVPARPGVYQVTATVTGKFNNNSQAVSATTTFPWTVIAPVARLPIFLGAPYQGKGLRVRPPEITYTGDGTGFFAGSGRPGHRPRVGRLHWSQWTPTSARAIGADWIDNCNPDCAGGYRRGYGVALHASAPEVIAGHNVFTRLAVSYTHKIPPYVRKRSYVLRLEYHQGFYWNAIR